MHRGRFWVLAMGALALGCGSSPEAATAPAPVESAGQEEVIAEAPPPPAQHGVEVKGLEGTLQAYDVRETMNRQLDALGACQQERVRRVRHLAGSIELAIHVRVDGSVSQADVITSDLGDLETEQCLAQVTLDTRFPKPHGGEADVKWNLHLDPLSAGRQPDAREAEELAGPLELLLPNAAEHCEMTRRSPRMKVTAYVARSGKVLTAGAATQRLGQQELLACVAREVKNWQFPRAERTAKVTFQAMYKRPLSDTQKQAIRKRQARERKAAADAERKSRRRAKREKPSKKARKKPARS